MSKNIKLNAKWNGDVVELNYKRQSTKMFYPWSQVENEYTFKISENRYFQTKEPFEFLMNEIQIPRSFKPLRVVEESRENYETTKLLNRKTKNLTHATKKQMKFLIETNYL